jgi:hypothetical protein
MDDAVVERDADAAVFVALWTQTGKGGEGRRRRRRRSAISSRR